MKSHLQAVRVNDDEFPVDGRASEQLEYLLRFAILAPSPNNTQPWLFRINNTDVELFADSRRWLKVVDPDARELTLSCGAALFNLQVATDYYGHASQVEIQPPSKEPNLLARFHIGLRCETASETVVLFQAIAQRHTHRGPFLEQAVSPALLEELEAAAAEYETWFHVVNEESLRQFVADTVAEADRRQWANKAFREELAHWIRTKIEEQNDGVPMSVAGYKSWLSFAGPTLVRSFDHGEAIAKANHELALQSPVLVLLSTNNDDASAWMSAGQALQRVLLEAQSEGIEASFLNQPIEVAELRPYLAENLDCSGYPQILLRMGYGPEAGPSPRRDVRQFLIRH
jgi:hypothetical protein